MNEKELDLLKARADNDDPVAMFAYAEYIRQSDQKEADKLTFLSAMLGYPPAIEHRGDELLDAGDVNGARHCYKIAARAGLVDCSVKFAILGMDFNEHASLLELEGLAQSGVKSAASALASYYKTNGNRKAYQFWSSLLK